MMNIIEKLTADTEKAEKAEEKEEKKTMKKDIEDMTLEDVKDQLTTNTLNDSVANSDGTVDLTFILKDCQVVLRSVKPHDFGTLSDLEKEYYFDSQENIDLAIAEASDSDIDIAERN